MPFGHDSLLTMLTLADHGIRQLIEKQRAIVGHIVPNREGQRFRVQGSGCGEVRNSRNARKAKPR